MLEFPCGWVGVVSVLQASGIKLVFYSSTVTMTHGPIYIIFIGRVYYSSMMRAADVLPP